MVTIGAGLMSIDPNPLTDIISIVVLAGMVISQLGKSKRQYRH